MQSNKKAGGDAFFDDSLVDGQQHGGRHNPNFDVLLNSSYLVIR